MTTEVTRSRSEPLTVTTEALAVASVRSMPVAIGFTTSISSVKACFPDSRVTVMAPSLAVEGCVAKILPSDR